MEEFMIQSEPHHVPNMVEEVLWYGHVWLLMEKTQQCLLIAADITKKINGLNSQSQSARCYNSIVLNTKHTTNVSQDFNRKEIFFGGQISHLIATHVFQFLKTKNHEQASTEGGCSENPEGSPWRNLMMFMGSRVQTAADCKEFFIKT